MIIKFGIVGTDLRVCPPDGQSRRIAPIFHWRALNPDLMQFANLEIVAGPDQRGRAVLFDYRWACAAEARFQRIAAIDLRIGPAACASYIDVALLRRLGFDRRAG